MVKFEAKLRDNQRTKWREFYIDYAKLKKYLKTQKKRRSRTDSLLTSKPLRGWFKLNSTTAAEEDSGSDEESVARGAESTVSDVEDQESLDERTPLRRSSGAPSTTPLYDATTPTSIQTRGTSEDLFSFFRFKVLQELDKVEKFYTMRMEDHSQEFLALVEQVRVAISPQRRSSNPSETVVGPLTRDELRRARALPAKVQDTIERALTDLNRELAMLKNFCIINYTAFVKILKKYDKTTPGWPLTGDLLPAVEESDFFEHQALNKLVDELTTMYAGIFCNYDKNQASGLLLPKRLSMPIDFFLLHLGYKLGLSACLAIWVVWDCVVQVAKFGKPTVVTKMAFPVYRFTGGLLLLEWCWGLVHVACSKLRINFVYLLDLNPKHVFTSRAIFDDAVNSSIVFLCSVLLYYKVLVGGFPLWIPPGFYPLAVFLYAILKLVLPWKQRSGLWQTLGKVVASPFFAVSFLDTVVADVLTSMVKVLLDLVWSIYYFASGDFLRDSAEYDISDAGQWNNGYMLTRVISPIVVILPLWWRFMQCLRRYRDTGDRWPHLANAVKYAFAQTVTLFGAFHKVYYDSRDFGFGEGAKYDGLWIVIMGVSTLYSYIWDVRLDWGLGQWSKSLLNERRMFPKDFPYYAAIFTDLFLRFLWVNTLIPPGTSFLPAYLTSLLIVMEIIRRSFWLVLRLENEQLRNTQGFRRVDVIPLSFDTEMAHDYSDMKGNNFQVMVEVNMVAGVVVLLSIAAVVVAARMEN